MENIFFLVLVLVVGLVRWLVQVAENKKNAEAAKRAGNAETPNAPPTFSRPPAETEEERIRRFMEALGVPTSSAPPPKVQPQPAEPKQTQPKRKFMPVDPFPVPRSARAEQRPPVVVAAPPPPPLPPPVVLPPPLPRRETPAPAEPLRPVTTSGDFFEVQDIDAAAAEDMRGAAGRSQPGRSPQPAMPEGGIAARLATSQGLRDAIIAREIFGPPRSMQPTDAPR